MVPFGGPATGIGDPDETPVVGLAAPPVDAATAATLDTQRGRRAGGGPRPEIGTTQFEKDVLRAQTAIATHYDLGGWSLHTQVPLTRTVARRLVEADRAVPEARIMGMLDDDFERALVLSDPEILGRLQGGASLFDPEVTNLIDSFTDAALAQVSVGLYHQRLAEAEGARRGLVENLTSRGGFTHGAAQTPEERNAGVLITDLAAQGADWVFDPDSRVLSIQAGDVGNVIVRLDEGTDIGSNLDVTEAILAATRGDAHTVIRNDPIPGGPNLAGKLLDGLSSLGRWVEQGGIGRVAWEGVASGLRAGWAVTTAPVTGPLSVIPGFEDLPGVVTPAEALRDPLVLDPIRRRAETDLMARRLGDTEAAAAAVARGEGAPVVWAAVKIADANRTAGGDPLELDTLLAMGEELYVTDQARIDDEITQMTTADIEATFDLLDDDQAALGRWIGTGIGGALAVFDAWDVVNQHIGIGFFDALGDVGASLAAVTQGDLSEGLRRFGDVFGEYPTDVDTVGDYFNLEGDWREYANLGASIVFDPFNLAFFGPTATRGVFRLMTTDPRFTRLFAHQPQWRAFARNLVEGGPESVMSVAGLSGLSTPARRELRAIAGAASLPKGSPGYDDAVRRVAQIITDELPGSGLGGRFMGDGVGRASRRQTALGLGNLFTGGPSKVDEVLESPTLVKALANGSSDRFIPLGEHVYDDIVQDMAVQLWHSDPATASRWLDELDDVLDAASSSRSARTGVATVRMQEITDELATLRREARVLRADGTAVGVDQLNDLVTEKAAIDRILSEWATTGATPAAVAEPAADDIARAAADLGIGTDEAADMLRATVAGDEQVALAARSDELTDLIGRLRPVADDLAARTAEITRRAGKLRVDLNVLDEPNARGGLIDFVYRMFSDKAETLTWVDDTGTERVGLRKLTDTAGKPMVYPGSTVQMHDWTPVTGRNRQFTINVPEADGVSNWALGFIGGADQPADIQFASDLARLINTDPNTLRLPVSTAELLAYESMTDKTAWAKVISAVDRLAGSRFAQAARSAFGINLLFNFTTPIKTHLDEIIRFYAQTGSIPDTLLAVRESPWLRGLLNTLGVPAGGTSPAAAAYSRATTSGLGKSTVGRFSWVTKPARRGGGWEHYRDQVNRFLGVFTTDDAYRAYANAKVTGEAVPAIGSVTGAPASFARWWDEVGQATRAGFSVGADGVSAAGAADAWRVIDRGFDLFMERMVTGNPQLKARVRRALLDAAAKGEPTQFSDEIVRAFKQVPGIPRFDDAKGWLGHALDSRWEQMYGTPSQRRGAVFFDYGYDMNLGPLVEGHQRAGTLLDEERLVTELAKAGQTVTPEQARQMLLDGFNNSHVAQVLANDTNLTLLTTLEARARALAARFSDDLMYRMTAASALGKAVDNPLMFPFARAQNDFMSWWTKYLFRPMQMRTGLTAQGSVTRRASWLEENASAFQKALNGVATTVERVPLNFRVWSRFAHLASAHSDQHESGLDKLIEAVTFLPLKFTNNVLMNLYPQLGPASDFTLDLFANVGVAGQVATDVTNSIFPGLSFTEPIDLTSPPGIIGDLLERVFPDNPRALRAQAGAASMFLSALMGKAFDPRTAAGWTQALATILAYDSLPVGYLDSVTADYGAWLGENLFEVPYGPGSPEFRAETGRISYDNLTERARSEALNRFGRQVPFVERITSERRSLINYRSLVENAGLLFDLGLLGGQDVEELPAAWENYLAGKATDREIQYLGDVAANLLFDKMPGVVISGTYDLRDWMVATNPELAAMMVSKFTISDAADPEWREKFWNESRKRFQFPPGAEGRDARFEGLTKGYMVNVRDDEWKADAAHAGYSAASRLLSQWWEAETGREWSTGMDEATRNKRFTLSEEDAATLRTFHLPIDAGVYTGAELREVFDAQKDSWRRPFSQNDLVTTDSFARLSGRGADGRQIYLAIEDAYKDLSKTGIDSFYDWPEEWKQWGREVFGVAVSLGLMTPEGYRQDIEPYFGAIDFAPPEVPLAGDLDDDRKLVVPSTWSTVGSGAPGAAQVIDGDSVRLFSADGEVEVRIIGVAAPERTEAGYGEATARLAAFMENHDVEFRVWQPEVYGLSQAVGIADRVRLRLWMYADGVPVFDPSLFTSENPLGRERSIGAVPDYEGMLRAQKERFGIEVEAVS